MQSKDKITACISALKNDSILAELEKLVVELAAENERLLAENERYAAEAAAQREESTKLLELFREHLSAKDAAARSTHERERLRLENRELKEKLKEAAEGIEAKKRYDAEYEKLLSIRSIVEGPGRAEEKARMEEEIAALRKEYENVQSEYESKRRQIRELMDEMQKAGTA